jgi:hypothetical protein
MDKTPFESWIVNTRLASYGCGERAVRWPVVRLFVRVCTNKIGGRPRDGSLSTLEIVVGICKTK